MNERTHKKSNWSSTLPQQDSALKLRRFTTKDDKDEEIQQSPDINLSKFSLSTNSPFPDSNIQRQELEEEKEENQDNEVVQTKLTVGEPGDKYEQEADTVAAKVVEQINSPQTNQPIQGKVEPVVKPTVMRQGGAAGGTVNQDVEQNIQQARGSGQGLAENVRQPMEQAFGADFSGVKVHTDGQADVLNRSLNSRAFATGQDIFFKQGEYQPGSKQGQELLAHELTHVVQQGGVTQVQHKAPLSTPLNSQYRFGSLAKTIPVFQKSSCSLISKKSSAKSSRKFLDIPGGAKFKQVTSGETTAKLEEYLIQMAKDITGRGLGLEEYKKFQKVIEKASNSLEKDLDNTNIPINFKTDEGINIHWIGHIRFGRHKEKVVRKPYQAKLEEKQGTNLNQLDKTTHSQTTGWKIGGGLKAGKKFIPKNISTEFGVDGELSSSDINAEETTSSNTKSREVTTKAEHMLVDYEAPLVTEIYLNPIVDFSDIDDYINPVKWYHKTHVLQDKRRRFMSGKIRYTLLSS